MEALVLIFAEILLACMAPLLGLVGVMFGALLELLAAIFGGIFAAWADTRSTRTKEDKPAKPRKPLIPRKVIHLGAGIMAGIGVLGVVASFVLFQPLLRHIVSTGAEKAGMHITYDSAEGTLLAGDVTLHGIHVTRPEDLGLGFDLKIATARADVDVWSLLSGTPVIESAQVEGVTGHVSPPKRDKDKPRKRRRPFRADLVQVAGVDLEIRPREGTPYSLVIPQAEVSPLGSRTALFDLLFRSNMQAEVAGQPLSVETREITEFGRETLWRFENVEADRLKLLVPRAPLTWLSGGVLNIRVDDRWSLSEDWIEMDWHIGFDGVSATAPAGAGPKETLLAKGLGKALAAKGGTADIGYRLSLTQSDIESLRSGNLDQFWERVLSGFLKPGAMSLKGDKDTGADDGQDDADADKPGLLNRLRGVLDRDSEDGE